MDGHVASLDGGATGGAAGRAGGFAGAAFRGERGRTDRGSVDVSLCGSPPRPLLNLPPFPPFPFLPWSPRTAGPPALGARAGASPGA